MNWRDLGREIEDDLEILHGLGNPLPPGEHGVALPNVILQRRFEAEEKNRDHIDQLCVQYTKGPRKSWPGLNQDELYFVIVRYSSAARIAAALACPTLSEPNRPVFPSIEGNGSRELEWLLLVVWRLSGLELWRQTVALDLFEKARKAEVDARTK